jgi:hypothetical protein
MREIVIVGDAAAYLDGVRVADFGWREDARAAMDAFARRYRAAGWTVHDHRPTELSEPTVAVNAGLAA